MHLTRIQAWNFRSFWSPDVEDAAALDLTLSPGVNYLSGPNNAGKSNVLRALAFALNADAPFDLKVDRSMGQKEGPSVVLEIDFGPTPSPKAQRLLDHVDEYERAIEGFQEPSLASKHILRFFVHQHDTWREEKFLTRDSWESAKGGKSGKIRQRAVELLRELIRYVDIKSGEDLQSLLQRGFKDVLASAVLDEHAKAMRSAEAAREAYLHALGQMLRPIARHVQDRIRPYVRDVEEIDLVAQIPDVEDALAAARVEVKDAFQTALEHKGTGVRGAMLLLLLSFIADSAKTAVVFGIEEPEAFLHPDAHRALGEGLARFTQREDVTLLVTTHSPFLFRTEDDARNAVFRVTKDADGRSSVVKASAESARADLLGSQVLSSALQKIETVPDSTRLILVVEGETDARYFQLASRALGISLSGIHIAWQRGALAVFMQSLALAAQHAPARRVVAVFDNDEAAKEYFDLLSHRLGWKNKASEGLHAFTYEKWRPNNGGPIEAEDLFDDAVLKRFLDEPGNSAYCTGTQLNKKQQRWHYDLDRDGKVAFTRWLEENVAPDVFEPWRPVLQDLAALAKSAGVK